MFGKFALKITLFLSPIVLLVLGYFYFDPFMILKKYDVYPNNFAKSLNRDRISTQIFINNNPKFHYNSFIFGSSRSSVFYTNAWATHISEKTPFHFDASCETIYGIASKLDFIDKQGNNIKNALFVMDGGTFAYEQDTLGTIFVQDYRVSGLSRWKYQLIFANSYLSRGFFVAFYDYLFFGKFRPYMRNYLEFREINYTPIYNDFIFTGYIKEIAKDSLKYYNQPDFFYQRPKNPVVGIPVIKPYQINYLKKIQSLLQKHHTNYKIVIGPMYNQVIFNPTDLKILNDIFGSSHIYNYSGKNRFSENMGNYYEIYHYKPQVANEIMREIYQTTK